MPDLIWEPLPLSENHSRMAAFLAFVNEEAQQKFSDYPALHAWSVAEPDNFWMLLARFFHIHFDTPPTRILDDHEGMFGAQWFAGSTLSFVRHVLARKDDREALVCLNESADRTIIRFSELHTLVAQCAAGLREAGVTAGSRVCGILPNSHYAVIAMLATASLGAIWSSCSPDFGLHAATDRLGQAEPTVLFLGNSRSWQGKSHDDPGKAATYLQALPSLARLVLCPVPGESQDLGDTRTVLWDDFLKPADSPDFTPWPFSHPLYLLFSSGTTGKPKGIVHGAGGTLLQHIKELGLHTDLGTEDKLFFYTTCGWMMWNWMVSALALGTTLVLYDGSPVWPTANRLFEIMDTENVTVFGTSARFLSVVEKSGIKPRSTCLLKALRMILSTGSPLVAANYDFVVDAIKPGIPICSISGGTDIVSCFALGNPLLPVWRGELQAPGLGMAVEVFDETGKSVRETRGELVCTRPFVSMPVCFWNDPAHKAYHKAYFERFPGVWAHGDYAEITARGGLIIHGRSDAVLNPGGVRIGTAEIYRQIATIPGIVDSVVIAQEWEDDVRVVLFVQLAEGLTLDESLCQTIRKTLRENASPRHVPAKILSVPDIPRTLSGKTVELAVREAVHGRPVGNLDALANPEALQYFTDRPELDVEQAGGHAPGT